MDNKTIADFQNNNNFNIELVIQTYNPYIYTIVKNYISNKEDIEEVLSDVFMVIWKNYQKVDKNIKIKPYLVGITKNLIKKKYRSIYIYHTIENIEYYENELTNSIDINNMKEEEKEIFIKFYYKSEKIKEISKELNISEGKVKVILHRLRKSVRKKLKERGYSYGK